jgi:hypothetical protein
VLTSLDCDQLAFDLGLFCTALPADLGLDSDTQTGREGSQRRGTGIILQRITCDFTQMRNLKDRSGREPGPLMVT